MGKCIVIIDGTQLYSGDRKINDKCLERHYNKGTEQETVNYHVDVLEAKIYFGSGLVCSICSEFIENNGDDAEKYKNMNLFHKVLPDMGDLLLWEIIGK
ncbi:hypothetical protein [Anaerocolumna sp. MB42-C2]|uniref:hypothetical protein n=1 Tax=Anaerocolumna sp. MB42-C2 TaxID=3070997 RepID=UPI0027E1F007|nr:hypothetical protein [Anaerocolumna sp. MB42-C2]WMJ86460.1 hypothetical protein RBU59_20830 [Anaerocolumna sp. MB42-C2]